MFKRSLVFAAGLFLLVVSVVSAQDDSSLQAWADTPRSAFNISSQVEWPVYTSIFGGVSYYRAGGDVVPTCVTSHSHSIWHTFVAPQTGRITLSTQGSNYDALVAVFVNEPTLSNQIACFNAVTGAGTWESGSIVMRARTRYYVMLAAVDDGVGVDLSSEMTVTYSSNNDRTHAFHIPGSGNYSNIQTNIETSSAEFAEMDVAMGPGLCLRHNHRVYYRFRPTVSGRYEFSTLDSTYDTLIIIATPVHRVSCNDDINNRNGNSRLQVELTAGETYFIAIGQSSAAWPHQTDNMVLSLRVRRMF